MESTGNGNSYGHDANGNMTTRTIGADVYVLSYDAENRLTSVSGGATASFVYDGDNKRVKATIGGTTTGYVSNYYEVVTTTEKYYSIGGVRVAMRDSGLANNPYYLLGDHLGSTPITADTSGSVSSERPYTAWGVSRYTSGTMPTDHCFTGRRQSYSTSRREHTCSRRLFSAGSSSALSACSAVGF